MQMPGPPARAHEKFVALSLLRPTGSPSVQWRLPSGILSKPLRPDKLCEKKMSSFFRANIAQKIAILKNCRICNLVVAKNVRKVRKMAPFPGIRDFRPAGACLQGRFAALQRFKAEPCWKACKR